MDTIPLTSAPEQEITLKLKRLRCWPAILALYVLAALIPECVATYNTAPRLFLANPVSFFFLTAFYGSANVLIRELVRQRPRGWASLLLLGMAFGFVNEGVVAGTWYTVVPGGYALIGGIDWAWAAALTAFHTIYSVVIPIFLVEAIFPAQARIPWLRRRGSIGFSVFFACTTSLIFFQSAYRLNRLFVLLIAAVLVVLAVCLPFSAQPRPLNPHKVPGLNRLRLAGLAGTLLYFGTIFLVPVLLAHILPATQHILAQAGIILAVLLVCLLFLVVVLRWSAYHAWGSHQQLALITGSLLPAILLSLFLPSAWLNAQPAVTLPCLALLIWAAYRTRESNFLPR